MNTPSQHPDAPQASAPDAHAERRTRIRKESILAGSCLGVGFIVMPGLIYAFGSNVLGPYGGGPHLGSFYGDFFRNLASGTFRTWLIALMPYLLVMALRLIFRPRTPPAAPSNAPLRAAESNAPAHSPASPERREPFVSP